MHDSERVNPCERPEQLLEVVPRAQQGHSREPARAREPGARDVPRDHGFEGLAVDVLHRERQAPVVLE